MGLASPPPFFLPVHFPFRVDLLFVQFTFVQRFSSNLNLTEPNRIGRNGLDENALDEKALDENWDFLQKNLLADVVCIKSPRCHTRRC